MSFETWMAFVLGAVLSWGVYVPVLHEGQAAMGGGSPSAGAVRAFLCVGIAYFITAVLIPLIALQFGLADGEPQLQGQRRSAQYPCLDVLDARRHRRRCGGPLHHLLDQER